MSFTHLQVRSGYSLMNSTITIDKLADKARELNFDAIALTDEHVLYGAIPFYKACKANGIKPIIGMSADVTVNEETEACILLAKNNDGYKNLIKISTRIQLSQKNSIELSELEKYSSHLICILATIDTKMETLLLTETHDKIKAYLDTSWGMFQQGDFYLGIQNHGLETERKVNNSVKAFHEIYQVPAVAWNDVRYLNEKDDIAYDCLRAMKQDKKWSLKITDPSIRQRHLRSTAEMEEVFHAYWPEAISNTEKIKNQCHVIFDFEKRMLPSYPVPDQLDAHTYLEKLCWTNLEQKYEHITEEIANRLTYELNIIQSMQFSDYFLIVWDFIAYAKENKILVGPGRGSAAGSLVSYVLGITEVDPIQYDLLFERFLNPERVTMPDIDIDFSDHRRDEVIEYVRHKYGDEHVAQIITFGTFAARSLLRELIKTIGIDQQDANFILKEIPVQAKKSITEFVKESNDLQQYIKQSAPLKALFAVAAKLEGLPRHISTHAAGVVISDKSLTEYVPLTIGANETYLTQFPMNDLEAIGLLKMDFLGLRNLTLLERIIRTIEYSTKQQINLTEIPAEDSKTYRLLQKGNTNGVFQLESQGMKQVLTRLKPTTFEDIVAVNALFRPGPMENIPVYISRKHGQEKVEYPHPDLKPILEKTYGVLIYQEQIMQIAHKIAGFSLGEADILRRAVSKKQQQVMEEQKESFIQGCLQNGYPENTAEEIFNWIVKFSNYGFNRSHAVAYSMISYQLAYLKAHFPAGFFAELLSSFASQQEKVHAYIKELKELGITLAPPSINKSYGKYSVEKDNIRMGLMSIKGIGNQVVKEIIQTRKDGPFKSLFDFCLRVSLKVVNRQALEILIMAGSFDELHENRASLLASIDRALEQGELFKEFTDQASLFQDMLDMETEYVDIEDFSLTKKLSDEKDLLGIYISSHPLANYRSSLINSGYVSMAKALKMIGKKKVKSAGIVQAMKKIRTKRGDPMAFVTIGDETGDMEGVIFPDLFRNVHRWLEEGMIITFSGNIEARNNQSQWLFSEIKAFNHDEWDQNKKQRLFIKLTEQNNENALSFIKETVTSHKGDSPVIVYYQENRATYQLSQDYLINPDNDCLQVLKKHFGDDNVVLED
ncbi:DNA polymerase III subunit alpha [Virgibacillus doumboii]|uniref:DNA polymerase III subunit alpha n=1 Tax=Virgibacillus doumboii TaxID=2697503 RepID=UPI0013E03D66|nr:DNA polymerase III subunit alpha [Virgibacillus doumboii]